MEKLDQITTRFDEITYSLSEDDIFKFDETDNGPINNVITHIQKHCYGVRLFEPENQIIIEMFYINNNGKLQGDLIQLQLDEEDYFVLLMRFCSMLSLKYENLDAITTFNTFQSKLRGFLEKLGFFTTTSIELKPYKDKNAVMFSSSKRGIKNVILIDRVEFYRTFFKDNYLITQVDNSEYVYLMVNNDTGYIKIGTSTNPTYRERTLHSKEPEIFIIALWRCDKKVEKELHLKFKNKRKRGEWFELTLIDIKEIEEYMTNYNCS